MKISKRKLTEIINEETFNLLRERTSTLLKDPKLKKAIDGLSRNRDKSYVEDVKDQVIKHIKNSDLKSSDKKHIIKTLKQQKKAMPLLQYIYNSILAYDDLRVSKGEMPLAR